MNVKKQAIFWSRIFEQWVIKNSAQVFNLAFFPEFMKKTKAAFSELSKQHLQTMQTVMCQQCVKKAKKISRVEIGSDKNIAFLG